ncbi:hypothetical protein [Streptomyces sp. NPDC058677]|uniref:hypothetical protein n=1 Tax=Streptomyces sp. NPDC058677 TaxID=3346594 RepID=UPI00365124C4
MDVSLGILSTLGTYLSAKPFWHEVVRVTRRHLASVLPVAPTTSTVMDVVVMIPPSAALMRGAGGGSAPCVEDGRDEEAMSGLLGPTVRGS